MASSPEMTTEPPQTPIPTPPACRDSEDDDGLGCRTPTSEGTRLPSGPALACPPAPRKRPGCGRWRRRRRLRRRDPAPEKISVGAEELEELFRWRDEEAGGAAAPGNKKPRRCNDSDYSS